MNFDPIGMPAQLANIGAGTAMMTINYALIKDFMYHDQYNFFTFGIFNL